MLEVGWEAIQGHKLTQPLGAGSFGSVWEARDKDGRAVALKFIDCRAHSPSMIRSEMRVLRALSSLRHPHIIQLHGIHATKHYIVLCMERADGNLGHLREAYQEEAQTNIPTDHALELLEQAADALDFLAGVSLPALSMGTRGLQHCDVKPSNLLLLGKSVKVADFGLCVGTSWGSKGAGWRGTVPYAAPELYSSSPTPTTDQFGLAVTFCELCMGGRPFWGLSSAEAPTGLPIDLRKMRANELAVFTRAMHPQPSARWPSCRAFVAALRTAAAQPRPRSGGRGPRGAKVR